MAYMITTVDNPFDPRLDFKAWDEWDRAHGYNTSSYLDRVAGLPDDMPDVMVDAMRDLAILEIIEAHNGGMYEALTVGEDNNTKSSTAAA